MNDEEKTKEEIFNTAAEIQNSADRAAYLDKVCGEDQELRRDIESLLKSDQEAGDFLEVPPLDPGITPDTSSLAEGPGSVIGRYKLLEKIGEGGMAVVYLAEQEQPVRRKVALKIIKLGMDTRQVIARFEAERQALAMMDHPNIAKVLEAGATETGRPYFVMDLVKGIPVTRYCDENNLSTKERLKLFTAVCGTIQHAHQKGIIHRDVKPTNVLVQVQDGKAAPKVIDFGIAKATNQKLTEKTLFTHFQQLVGTPEYMSPEQAEWGASDIDTRTDIYSLGVLLYELLTGVTPFDAVRLREAGYNGMMEIIKKEEPTRPSTRLETVGDTLGDIAAHRKSSPEGLRRLLHGDLDWIVMKALDKDRGRRYETAAEFGADINRHLMDEAVIAGAPKVGYKIRKFVRRNRALVAGVGAVVVVLVCGIVVSTVFAFGQARARREAERQTIEAQRQEEIANGVSSFLNSHVIGQLSPYRAQGGEVTVRSVLDSASQALEGKFEDEPLIEASIRYALGATYWRWGCLEDAERHLERAYKIQRQQLGENDSVTLASRRMLTVLYNEWSRYDEAESIQVDVVERMRISPGAEHPRTLLAIYTQSRSRMR